MTADRNCAAARRISFELFAAGQVALLDELTTPDFVNHGQTGGVPEADGRASLANAVARVRGGFPDLRYELLHEVAEGDFVVHHLQAQGTHLGEFAGATPSGRAAQWREVHIMRFEDARMAEQWGVVDRLAVLQQIGLMPPPRRA